MVHRYHVVLGRRLEALVFARGVGLLEVEQLLLVKRRKVFFGGGAEVAAGTFHPKYFDGLAGQGVFVGELRRCIAAAGVGDALVGAELVGAVNKPVHAALFPGFRVVPEVVYVLVSLLSHKNSLRNGAVE